MHDYQDIDMHALIILMTKSRMLTAALLAESNGFTWSDKSQDVIMRYRRSSLCESSEGSKPTIS